MVVHTLLVGLGADEELEDEEEHGETGMLEL